jgi:hypothetical protein
VKKNQELYSSSDVAGLRLTNVNCTGGLPLYSYVITTYLLIDSRGLLFKGSNDI